MSADHKIIKMIRILAKFCIGNKKATNLPQLKYSMYNLYTLSIKMRLFIFGEIIFLENWTETFIFVFSTKVQLLRSNVINNFWENLVDIKHWNAQKQSDISTKFCNQFQLSVGIISLCHFDILIELHAEGSFLFPSF